METKEIRRAAVVTGGGRGIGRAVCVRLAKEGCDVCINFAGNAAAAEETAKLCREAGGEEIRIITVKADISREEEADRLIAEAMEAFGRVDILVNNAGITRDNIMLRMSAEDFDQVIGTNLRGTFLCCKAVTRAMMRQKYGRIINLSSIVGIHGNAGQENYAASKAGVIGLTKSIAKELASRNITANAVAPGYIATDMTANLPEKEKEAILAGIPAKRIGTPEDVAEAVAFLASEKAGYINGQVLGVDGGM
ncbi:MAG: 3-oxoacyl-[acyl-carrier-protein] reductase [Bacillota bacterium]|nr:3-oxoacyl-[acyl-carrier-protein] reductase [Bacillota bacterium]